MDRLAFILASELNDAERDALHKAASTRLAFVSSLSEDLRRLRLVDPSHAELTPLGRDVWRLLRQNKRVEGPSG